MQNGAVITRPVVAAPVELSVHDVAREFQRGLPFRHVVIDRFLDPEIASRVAGEFHAALPGWTIREHLHSRKLTCQVVHSHGLAVVEALHSQPMLDWLEAVTGAKHLTGDDELFGGGLHYSTRGSFLDIHADFSRHPHTGHQRVLNLLIYLNDVSPLYGGALELWDAGVTQCLKTIRPAFNRAVLFETHDRSFHGHPDPMTCPDGEGRKSLALYYYRPHKPWDVNVPTTDYRPRPQDYYKRLRKWVARLVK